MTHEVSFRLGEVLGLARDCPFLGPEERIELVEGRLAAERLEAFRAHARDCADCSAWIDDVDLFNELTTSGVAIATEARAFERSSAALRRKLGRRRIRWWAYWLTPALASLLVVLVWLWPTPPRMIRDIERFPLVPPPAVRGLAMSEVWKSVREAWDADDMRDAASRLEAARMERPDEPDLLFYLGVARLRSGDAAGAVDALAEADRLQAAAPSEHTRWMLAAALERLGRTEQACETLRSVVGLGASRAERAREIVRASCPGTAGDPSAP